jgi:hypothetical protein
MTARRTNGTSDTKAMEDALQAAVARMNGTNGAGHSAPSDPLSMVASLLPALLQNRESREDILEKLDELQSEELSTLREQMRLARVQIHRLRKSSQEVIEVLHQMREQQAAIGEAVLHVARQLARFERVDDMPDELVEDPELEELAEMAAPSRTPRSSSKKTSRRTSTNKNPREPR